MKIKYLGTMLLDTLLAGASKATNPGVLFIGDDTLDPPNAGIRKTKGCKLQW